MTSIQTIAPRDEVRRFTVRLEGKLDGQVVKILVPVEYYRNRISLAPLDGLVEKIVSEDELADLSNNEYDAIQSACTLCHYLKSWDLQGAVYKPTGEEIVGEDEDIPLDPRIVQHVPTTVIGEFMRQLTEEVFPNARPSRNERRRSR